MAALPDKGKWHAMPRCGSERTRNVRTGGVVCAEGGVYFDLRGEIVVSRGLT